MVKKIVLLLLICLFSLQLHAQILAGKVFRNNSDTVIANATVYFGGTMRGTTTNQKGEFSISAEQTKVPLVVSSIGYFSATITEYKAGEPLTIRLKTKVNELKEVVIGFDGMTREDKIKLFLKQFLGDSYFAINCSILNMDDIDFTWSKKTKTLKAFCDKPILIKNKKLGYIISYYLDRFNVTGSHISFAGNYVFREDTLQKPSDLKKIKSNREDAYAGSRMQFIRALFRNNLQEAGFRIYDPKYQPLTAFDVLQKDDLNERFILTTEGIRIVYKKDFIKVSTLSTDDVPAIIDKDGYYGMGLHWAGYMGGQRIGDLLPFEYRSELDN